MPFRLNQSKSYKYDVVFNYLDENGYEKKQTFKVKFKRLNKKDREAIQSNNYDSDTQLLEEFLLDWDGVQDEKGEEIPYTINNLQNIDEDCPELIAAIVYSFYDSHRKMTEKNSKQ